MRVDLTDAARREALDLLRLIAELEWTLASDPELSPAQAADILESLLKAHDALARILAALH